mmetsp:Transcript_7807/g.23891  ORF Transcript_7807/g.23891 Transcript_7807/m.23891 type:complete len:261 (+) Transcript_7807:472-1254(+)
MKWVMGRRREVAFEGGRKEGRNERGCGPSSARGLGEAERSVEVVGDVALDAALPGPVESGGGVFVREALGFLVVVGLGGGGGAEGLVPGAEVAVVGEGGEEGGVLGAIGGGRGESIVDEEEGVEHGGGGPLGLVVAGDEEEGGVAAVGVVEGHGVCGRDEVVLGAVDKEDGRGGVSHVCDVGDGRDVEDVEAGAVLDGGADEGEGGLGDGGEHELTGAGPRLGVGGLGRGRGRGGLTGGAGAAAGLGDELSAEVDEGGVG